MKKAQAQRPQALIRVKFFIILVVVLIPIVAAVSYGISTYAKNQDKAAQDEVAYQADKVTFPKVEANMDAAYAEIVAAIGKPEVENKGKGCGRPNMKFSEGNLNCAITYTFAYPVDTIQNSANQALKLQDTLDASKQFMGVSKDFRFSSDLTVGGDALRSNSLSLGNKYGFYCRVDHYFGRPELYHDYDFDTIQSAHFTYYQLSCSAEVSKPIYS